MLYSNTELRSCVKMDNYYTRIMLKNGTLSKKIKVVVLNTSYTSIENVEVFITFTIPHGLALAQVDINTEIDNKLKILSDGKALIQTKILKMKPSEDETIVIHVYYAGELSSPEYILDSSVYLMLNGELYDAKSTQEKILTTPDTKILEQEKYRII
ncbi:hypothetical protein PV797_14890 [Clostridiaceae bacterium M8S5]|nr:hypothetical protein PV797_14890 [Clostridiaceae bacterium M8S5]